MPQKEQGNESYDEDHRGRVRPVRRHHRPRGREPDQERHVRGNGNTGELGRVRDRREHLVWEVPLRQLDVLQLQRRRRDKDGKYRRPRQGRQHLDGHDRSAGRHLRALHSVLNGQRFKRERVRRAGPRRSYRGRLSRDVHLRRAQQGQSCDYVHRACRSRRACHLRRERKDNDYLRAVVLKGSRHPERHLYIPSAAAGRLQGQLEHLRGHFHCSLRRRPQRSDARRGARRRHLLRHGRRGQRDAFRHEHRVERPHAVGDRARHADDQRREHDCRIRLRPWHLYALHGGFDRHGGWRDACARYARHGRSRAYPDCRGELCHAHDCT